MTSIGKNRSLTRMPRFSGGFTLIEVLVVIGIISILAGIVIVAINPSKQFAQARNTERQSNVGAILSAIGQRMADNKGTFNGSFTVSSITYTCPTLPATATIIGSAVGQIDLNCLTPTYISSQIPVDPVGGRWTDATSYDSRYTVLVDASGRVTVCAPNAANETSIPDAASICVTR